MDIKVSIRAKLIVDFPVDSLKDQVIKMNNGQEPLFDELYNWLKQRGTVTKFVYDVNAVPTSKPVKLQQKGRLLHNVPRGQKQLT